MKNSFWFCVTCLGLMSCSDNKPAVNASPLEQKTAQNDADTLCSSSEMVYDYEEHLEAIASSVDSNDKRVTTFIHAFRNHIIDTVIQKKEETIQLFMGKRGYALHVKGLKQMKTFSYDTLYYDAIKPCWKATDYWRPNVVDEEILEEPDTTKHSSDVTHSTH